MDRRTGVSAAELSNANGSDDPAFYDGVVKKKHGGRKKSKVKERNIPPSEQRRELLTFPTRARSGAVSALSLLLYDAVGRDKTKKNLRTTQATTPMLQSLHSSPTCCCD